MPSRIHQPARHLPPRLRLQAAEAKASYWRAHIDPATTGDRNGGAHFAYLSHLVERYGGEWAVGDKLRCVGLLPSCRELCMCAAGGLLGRSPTPTAAACLRPGPSAHNLTCTLKHHQMQHRRHPNCGHLRRARSHLGGRAAGHPPQAGGRARQVRWVGVVWQWQRWVEHAAWGQPCRRSLELLASHHAACVLAMMQGGGASRCEGLPGEPPAL